MVVSTWSRFSAVFGVIALAVAALLLATPAGRLFTAPIRAVVKPVAGAVSSWAQQTRDRHASRGVLLRERDALRQDVMRLASLVRDDAVCREESQELKQLLDYQPGPSFLVRAARVLSRTQLGSERLVIDQGIRQGVVSGAAVIVGKGILAGRVIRTESEFSEVALLRDPTTKIPARIADTRHDAIVSMDAQGGLQLELVPAQVPVQAGDVVFSTGLDARMPRDLVIGVITEVRRSPESPFLRITLASPADALQPHMLLVVLPTGSSDTKTPL